MKGFSANSRDRTLMTPLHVAAYYGQATCANALLKMGADALARDATGRTALHYASCSAEPTLITLLCGVCPEIINVKDNHGRSALHVSVYNSSQKQAFIF